MVSSSTLPRPSAFCLLLRARLHLPTHTYRTVHPHATCSVAVADRIQPIAPRCIAVGGCGTPILNDPTGLRAPRTAVHRPSRALTGDSRRALGPKATRSTRPARAPTPVPLSPSGSTTPLNYARCLLWHRLLGGTAALNGRLLFKR